MLISSWSEESALCCAFNPDGNSVVTGHHNGKVHVIYENDGISVHNISFILTDLASQ